MATLCFSDITRFKTVETGVCLCHTYIYIDIKVLNDIFTFSVNIFKDIMLMLVLCIEVYFHNPCLADIVGLHELHDEHFAFIYFLEIYLFF